MENGLNYLTANMDNSIKTLIIRLLNEINFDNFGLFFKVDLLDSKQINTLKDLFSKTRKIFFEGMNYEYDSFKKKYELNEKIDNLNDVLMLESILEKIGMSYDEYKEIETSLQIEDKETFSFLLSKVCKIKKEKIDEENKKLKEKIEKLRAKNSKLIE